MAMMSYPVWRLDTGQGAHCQWYVRELKQKRSRGIILAGITWLIMQFEDIQHYAYMLENGCLRAHAIACNAWLQRISLLVVLC